MQNPPPFPACMAPRHLRYVAAVPVGAKNSPNAPYNAEFGPFLVRRENFLALTPTIGPRRANKFAHGTQPRGGFETNDTFAPTDAGQHETTSTTAHP